MSKYEKMVACNRKSSADKIELAKKTIFKMLDEGEKITIPKLIAKTGLSRGFFYKNPIVRSTHSSYYVRKSQYAGLKNLRCCGSP